MTENTDQTRTEDGEAPASKETHEPSVAPGIPPEVVGNTVDIVSRDWHGAEGSVDNDVPADTTHKTKPNSAREV